MIILRRTKLYFYSIWYRHSLWAAVHCTAAHREWRWLYNTVCTVQYLYFGCFEVKAFRITLQRISCSHRSGWQNFQRGSRAPAALLSRKPRYPFYRNLGGPQGRSERVRKISPPSGFDPETVQPVAWKEEVESFKHTTGCSFYREQGSCHYLFRRKQALYATRMPCSGTP
jgi:hypothetical protein